MGLLVRWSQWLQVRRDLWLQVRWSQWLQVRRDLWLQSLLNLYRMEETERLVMVVLEEMVLVLALRVEER
jgi:hypothetical protein